MNRPPRIRRAPRQLTQRRRVDDHGSVGVELALGVPLGVLFLFLVVGAFHLGRATIDVNSAAAAASRAASIARTASAADAAAHDTATADLAGQCASTSTRVDTSQFHRGGSVTVQVSCTVTTHGLIGVGLPGTITVTASSTSPLDLYRAAGAGFTDPEATSRMNVGNGGVRWA